MHGVILRSALAAAVLSLGLAAAAPVGAAPPGGTFQITNLVSNVPGLAQIPDPNLVNAWGLTRSATSPWWISDNGTNLSTLYDTSVSPPAIVPLVVGVPNAPTGVVFAGVAGNFPIATTATPNTGPAAFIFDTEDGQILAWRGGTTALAPAPLSGGFGDAVFKGLAIAPTAPGGPLLYATDFHNGHVLVFDGTWTNVTAPGAFTDPAIPDGFAPFGIQTIGSNVFVTYAKQDADAHDDVAGMSLGFVDEYDLMGNLVARVAQRGQLDSPWGLAIAPASFDRFAGDLLVGNFGNGQINAYTDATGTWTSDGALRDSASKKLVIDGLWALQFGNAGRNGNPDTLYFTAGPNDESDGLFGTILPG